jgi:lysophospholipid acyltransferase (LPLAT)-like uncharacterized protein
MGGRGRDRRGEWRKLRRRLRSLLVRPLFWLALHTLPALYVAYMRFVWATSRVSDHGLLELNEVGRRHNGAVALLWHEEVFSVAFAYPYIGIRGHTLASVSDLGHLIAKALERCGYVVFRGGSSSKRSRRRSAVLSDMIEHMQTHDRVIYGLTVDGSSGPAYRIKPGGVVIARACDKPIVLARTWYKRVIRLRTWDRTAIPLPFNAITTYMRGPYRVPKDAEEHEAFERFRRALENDLVDLAAHSYADMGHARPATLRYDDGGESAAQRAERRAQDEAREEFVAEARPLVVEIEAPLPPRSD